MTKKKIKIICSVYNGMKLKRLSPLAMGGMGDGRVKM